MRDSDVVEFPGRRTIRERRDPLSSQRERTLADDPLNLDEPAEWAGHWWLPDDPDERIPGVLRYEPGRGLALALIGTFEERVMSEPAPGVVMVHFVRNALARVSKASAEMVAAAIRTIFAQPSAQLVREQVDTVADMLAPKFPAVAELLHEAKADLTAFADFPTAHWRKTWSTNPIERSNREIKRRSDVVGTFPNPEAITRLVGAVLIEAHEEWQADQRRYLSEESMAALDTPSIQNGQQPQKASRARKAALTAA